MSQTIANPLADVIRAIQSLKPQSKADLLCLIRLLGYNFKSQTRQQADKKQQVRAPQKNRLMSGQPPPTKREPKQKIRKPIPSALSYRTDSEQAPPDWLRTVPHLEEDTPSRIRTQIPLETLFNPIWTRSILNDALSTPGGGGEIDIDRITRKISAAQPLTEIPRRQVPTLARGVQLLVDCSEAMQPFAGDQISLKSSIYRVVGRDKTQTLSFYGNPLWGAGSGLRDELPPYDPAPPGTPVLALTDLGIGNSVSFAERTKARDWLEFSDMLREHGCPLIAFVPYPESRWPDALRMTIKILQWDRPTNASAVRRAIGQALRI